jgi:hypothetical protein
MRLEPLYRLTFRYPESWRAGTDRFLIAEGSCEGRVSGRFRGANYARRAADGYAPLLHGAIATDDGAEVLIALTGHGAPQAGRVVASVVHTAEGEYAWLNETLGVVCGEVRGREILLDVAELVWEPIR